MKFLEMPNDCLRKIFSFLTFHEIALVRPVCRKFNAVAADLLKCEFCRLEQLIRDYRRELKLLLPRRESERRKHTLAGHADVLSAVETRLSLLGMTIMRYVDEGYCCFFPGKVLDELRRVYVIIKSSTSSISRSTELLRELRDISSMAMEHFDEVLLPQIYASKLQHQQRSLNELTYQRRIRTLHQASLLKNLNNSFPNLLDVGLVGSSNAIPPSIAAENQSSQSSQEDSCEPSVSDAHDLLTVAHLESVIRRMGVMQQTIFSFAASQRKMAERIGRLNNMIISVGYRLHKLEAKNGLSSSSDQDEASLKRSLAVLNGPCDNDNFCGPNKMTRYADLGAANNSELSSPSSSSNA